MKSKVDIEGKILETSFALFLKNGFKNTTMDEIAQKLGISKKTLYKHFSNKMVLLESSFEILKTRLSSQAEDILSHPQMTYSGKLKAMLKVVGKGLAHINPELLKDLRDHAPQVWDSLQAYIRDAAYLRFQRLIQDGIDQGYIDTQVNKNMVVLLYTAAIQNLIDPDFLSQFPREISGQIMANPTEVYDQAISIIYKGILTEEARTQLMNV
ncbi:TetR/AcrR family transcriptional regulator [Pararhodonellum marinum]|uniref:TetR/AcrR family transcriptional regulator n=1 Tax=Pararhodonellum marinum TaxID=2755358 RepID=UPI00188FA8A1|nr:TetR/AcrR family transcriptional regulator [Pararhodonellum marinum]